MSNKQRYDAMMVTEFEGREGKKSFWTKIGAGFTNKDGSIGVQLDAIPVNGKIILQVPLSKEEKEEKFGKRDRDRDDDRGGRKGGGFGRGGRGGGEAPNYPAAFDDHDEKGGGGFADEQ